MIEMFEALERISEQYLIAVGSHWYIIEKNLSATAVLVVLLMNIIVLSILAYIFQPKIRTATKSLANACIKFFFSGNRCIFILFASCILIIIVVALRTNGVQGLAPIGSIGGLFILAMIKTN